MNIAKVLVANRGEIAIRIMRTCREMGIQTVAVYSDADRLAAHVLEADEAYAIGPAPASASYLNAERIITVAQACGADAIHPGYGFLSENAAFANQCIAAGLCFIGPPAAAIVSMGDKTAARKLMAVAGVPMAPGTLDAVTSVEEAQAIADQIGYPVLVKAAAGGGGKGMRRVASAEDLRHAFRMAESEAASSFGDPRVFIEKFVDEPRHIEFQVLADAHGHVIHLFERECTIQRRHQKVIEETPSPLMTPALRAEMGAAAIEAARACGYVGVGTVEFLVDRNRDFYFMEMNTRLQVEHPITEEVTGLDLVREQLRIAMGEPLGLTQDDVSMRGHAIECRVYAEDVSHGFLPDPGPVLRHRIPAGPGVRVDAGVLEGGRVEVHYDPMISKLIVSADTRDSAIARMIRAIETYEIIGVSTTLPFGHFVMNHPVFRSGQYNTHFVEQFASEMPPPNDHVPPSAIAAGVVWRAAERARRSQDGPARIARQAHRPTDGA